ncbi:MAG: hypothetical protein A2287_05545 [Candidatus Melainabacteria bacterium RIFOXYA12_FULL_32_12]|nr:MAG: hypothetical protein A2255_04130 [Candidatus Melainabacteria bacterium RIFOXYA2_FULL_32_9]OGI30989.1 MAG: hypothetical protein A2287_05545 [Candidatus Melainabacteria bacterium RIFOXYA12_FULL_32_12]
MDKLLQNKAALGAIIGGVVLIIILAIVFGSKFGGEEKKVEDEKLKTEYERTLLMTDNLGKALEIQSLLAREGIKVDREAEGSKSALILDKSTTRGQRDRAFLTIVRSGIMDKNIGLEIFDKGDFQSSREDKRIRLARAINGELARLIKKIHPIEDASVFVSIPENTMFASMQKPITATVQVTLPPPGEDSNGEDKLDRDKIRTITNLLMGSVQGLEAKNISITDTNGSVYSSLMGPEEDMLTLLEEKDQYMKNKVMVQLDRLLGKGNYVVTVSTYLREAPLEASKIIYNPKQSSVLNSQRFRESLGDRSSDVNKYSSAVSSYVPGGLPVAGDSASDRNYGRTAEEVQYGVGRTQISEVKNPGMIEEISIAVTLDKAAIPMDTPVNDLKELVARAASPKVKASNVKIAFSDVSSSSFLSPERPPQIPIEESGNPWWLFAAIFSVLMILGLVFIAGRSKVAALKQQEEIDHLIQRTAAQENMLKEANNRAAQLQDMHQQLQNSITVNQPQPAISTLQETLTDIKGNIVETSDEKELAKTLKTWIESSE